MSVHVELHWVTKWQEVLGGLVLGVRGMFSTSEPEELAGPEHRGEAAGGPGPQMVLHLLCFQTELPSSQLWESALRASSDPPGSAFVTVHPSLSSSLCSVSVWFLLFLFPVFSAAFFYLFYPLQLVFSDVAGVYTENQSPLFPCSICLPFCFNFIRLEATEI